jgi:glutamyl-Q tRNA(Asp) synthetase
MVAAVGSYLDARHVGGEWLVRIEDIDPPREVPGAAADMLHTLEQYGFEWDGEVLYQSSRLKAYQEVANDLLSRRLAYPCGCSRKEITEVAAPGVDGPVYPGTCRNGHDPKSDSQALRLKTDSTPITYNDRLKGRMTQQLDRDIGDFIIRRRDGLTSYQLAVVVDDIYQGITDIVRGSDLLLSTPRQIYLQQLLGEATWRYAHLPLVIDSKGEKLSCQNMAPAVPRDDPVPTMLSVLEFLQQPLPEEPPSSVAELWQWAIPRWDIGRIATHKA